MECSDVRGLCMVNHNCALAFMTALLVLLARLNNGWFLLGVALDGGAQTSFSMPRWQAKQLRVVA